MALLPDSEEIEDQLLQKEVEVKGISTDDKEISKDLGSSEKINNSASQNPWKTEMHQTTQDDNELPQDKSSGNNLRRPTQQRRPNPKYANVALAKEHKKHHLRTLIG